MSLGERIEKFLVDNGYQRNWFAEKIGISKQQLNRIIKDGARPRNMDDIEASIRTHFQDHADWLVGKTNKNEIDILSISTLESTGETLNLANTTNRMVIKIKNSPFQNEIPNGALLILDTNISPSDGNFVVIMTNNNSVLLRKLHHHINNDLVTLESDIDKDACKLQAIKVIGVVIEIRVVF